MWVKSVSIDEKLDRLIAARKGVCNSRHKCCLCGGWIQTGHDFKNGGGFWGHIDCIEKRAAAREGEKV